MYQLFLCLLAASLAASWPVTETDYGLGTIATTQDFMTKDYDVVIFVNDDIYNLGESYAAIEKALTRYNGVCFELTKCLQIHKKNKFIVCSVCISA